MAAFTGGRRASLLAGLAVVSGVAAAAPGAIVTTATDGTDVDLLGGADSFVRRGATTPDTNTNTNFGADTTMAVKNNGGSVDTTDRLSYFRFDTSGIGTTTEALLRLTPSVATSTAGTFQLFGVPDLSAGENFIEGNGGADGTPTGELTWANAYGIDNSDNSLNEAAFFGSTFLASVSLPVGSTQLDFSSAALAAFLNADTNGSAGFVVTLGTTSTGFVPAFFTKEGSATTPPQLLTNANVPEPASLGLLGAAGLLLGRRRNRSAR